MLSETVHTHTSYEWLRIECCTLAFRLPIDRFIYHPLSISIFSHDRLHIHARALKVVTHFSPKPQSSHEFVKEHSLRICQSFR